MSRTPRFRPSRRNRHRHPLKLLRFVLPPSGEKYPPEVARVQTGIPEQVLERICVRYDFRPCPQECDTSERNGQDCR